MFSYLLARKKDDIPIGRIWHQSKDSRNYIRYSRVGNTFELNARKDGYYEDQLPRSNSCESLASSYYDTDDNYSVYTSSSYQSKYSRATGSVASYYSGASSSLSIAEMEGQPPTLSKLRTLSIFLMLSAPTIIVALLLNLAHSVWLAMGLFHGVACVLLPILYLYFTDHEEGLSSHGVSDQFAVVTVPTGLHFTSSNSDSSPPLSPLDMSEIQTPKLALSPTSLSPSASLHSISMSSVATPAKRSCFSQTVDRILTLFPARSEEYALGIKGFLRASNDGLKKQLAWAAVLLIISFGAFFALYALLRDFVPDVRAQAADFGLEQYQKTILISFMVYFSLVNPLLEEFFWRLFFTYTWARESLIRRAVVTFFYALYHLFVLLIFVPLWMAFVGLICVFFAGIAFAILHRHLGWLPSVAVHVAADAVIMIILGRPSV